MSGWSIYSLPSLVRKKGVPAERGEVWYARDADGFVVYAASRETLEWELSRWATADETSG